MGSKVLNRGSAPFINIASGRVFKVKRIEEETSADGRCVGAGENKFGVISAKSARSDRRSPTRQLHCTALHCTPSFLSPNKRVGLHLVHPLRLKPLPLAITPISHTTQSIQSAKMTRGNQREKAREKNLKDSASKKKNSQSGTEFQRTKEDQAAIMRAKQAAGNSGQL